MHPLVLHCHLLFLLFLCLNSGTRAVFRQSQLEISLSDTKIYTSSIFQCPEHECWSFEVRPFADNFYSCNVPQVQGLPSHWKRITKDFTISRTKHYYQLPHLLLSETLLLQLFLLSTRRLRVLQLLLWTQHHLHHQSPRCQSQVKSHLRRLPRRRHQVDNGASRTRAPLKQLCRWLSTMLADTVVQTVHRYSRARLAMILAPCKIMPPTPSTITTRRIRFPLAVFLEERHNSPQLTQVRYFPDALSFSGKLGSIIYFLNLLLLKKLSKPL